MGGWRPVDDLIRVVVADDHPLILAGILTCLRDAGLWLVGQASNGRQAQDLCCRLRPDVLVLDLRLGDDGPAASEIIEYLREHSPATRVVILSAYDNPTYVRSMLEAGASGYVVKDEALDSIVSAVRRVAAGDTWFSPAALEKLRSQECSFTPREQDVLARVARGWDNRLIADDLHLSARAVSEVLSAIYQKLNLPSSRAALVAWCHEHGY